MAYPSRTKSCATLRDLIKSRGHVQKRLGRPSTSSPHGINRNETQCAGSTRSRIAVSRKQDCSRIRSGAHNTDHGIIRGQMMRKRWRRELGRLKVESSVETWLQALFASVYSEIDSQNRQKAEILDTDTECEVRSGTRYSSAIANRATLSRLQ